MRHFRVLLGLTVAFAVLGGLAIYYAANEINQIEIDKEREEVRFLLTLTEKNALSIVRDYAEWDAMVEKGLIHPDPAFIKENLLALDLFDTFRIEEILLLNQQLGVQFCSHYRDNQPYYFKPRTLPKACCLKPHLNQLLTLIQRELTAHPRPIITYLKDEKRILQLAIAPVRASEDELPAGYLVFTTSVDHRTLQALATGLNLKSLILNFEPPRTSEVTFIPLSDITGKSVAYLVWMPHLPGNKFLNYGIRILVGAILLILALLFLYWRHWQQQQAHIHALEKQVETASAFDALTGALKREAFMQVVADTIKKYGETERFAFALLDISNFKALNQTLGLEGGDALLKIISQRMQLYCSMRNCTVTRYGSDQFGLLIFGWDDLAWLQVSLSAILKTLQAPIQIKGHTIEPHFHISVTLYPQDGETPETLCAKAETLLNLAKEQQRTDAPLFPDTRLIENMQRKQAIALALGHALKEKAFYLLYQPLVCAHCERTGHIVGAEVLLRWRSDTLGDVYPDEFIPVAEAEGVIQALEHWVLDEALRHYAQLQEKFGEDFQLSINLSPATLNDPELPEYLKSLQQKYDFPAWNIHLEVTERLLVEANQSAILHTLKNIGFSISLDDFGTGYSALSYLTSMPLDTLKIDKSFIDKILEGTEQDRHILEAIIQIASALKMEIVAEGVEKPEQAALLKTYRVTALQGYLYARPQPLYTLLGGPESIAVQTGQ